MRRLMLTALALLAACTGEPPQSAAPDDASGARPVRLHTVTAAARSQRHRFVARVDALQTVDLSFEVPGVLETMTVRAGGRLAPGTAAARLQQREYTLAVREAELARALAQQDLTRKQQLLSREGVSRALVDDASTLLALRDVQLEQAREALADTEIEVPFDAWVARRFVDPGAYLTVGTPVLRVHDLSSVLLTASVREELLATASAERVEALYAEFAFLPGERFELTFFERIGEADAVAQTYEVRFAMNVPEDVNILPGMSASVTVDLAAAGPTSSTPTVPIAALVPDPERANATEGFRVWRYDAERGVVEPAAVAIGPVSGTEVVVTEGIALGDEIVVAGADALRDGMRVRPMAAP